MSSRFWVVGVVVCAFVYAGSMAMTSQVLASPTLGFESSSVLASKADASLDLQAGSHPYALTATFKLNTTTDGEGRLVPEGGDLKDLVAELPPGLMVDPLATPRCGAEEFATVDSGTGEDGCPDASAVGVLAVENLKPLTLGERQVSTYPIYDLAPPQGVPALFGAMVANTAVYLAPSIRTGSDSGLTVALTGIPQGAHVLGSTVTLWGVPAEAAHDKERGDCVQSHETCPAGVSPKPLLALPTQCLTAPTASLRADSWQQPGQFNAVASDPITGGTVTLTACEGLDFAPSFDVQVESSTADSATGLKLHVHVPQNEDVVGLAAAGLQDAVVTLPPGMALNLALAGSVVGCPLEGTEAINLGSNQPASCPSASKIGAAKIKIPILGLELAGGVYLAQQGNLPGGGTNPFKSMIAIYIVAEGSGLVLKLPAEMRGDPQTGQLTMHIGPNPLTNQAFAPQLPFEDVELEFTGGEAGALVTPSTCGNYTAGALLAPWSGTAPVALTGELQVTQGCGQALSPSFSAGTADHQANGYSPFSATIARRDGEQEMKAYSVTTPAGMLATLTTGVQECPEPQASLGTCGAESLIGEVTASVGAGPNPFTVNGGKVFFTGPYGGGPFGLSLVMPANVGPLNLGPEGRPLVIREAVDIDPITAQVTTVTDREGPHSIPSILEGVVPEIRAVNVVLNRPEFIINPTKCAPQSIAAAITSTQGVTANVSVPFEATNCAALPFAPKLTAATVGRPSRANGIGLDVKIVEGFVRESNARSVHVELPKQLPSRLTTLRNACLVAVFDANPASCPPGAIVGTASAVTALLPVPVVGPAYFVSHGGAKFPELVIVLQGDGVTSELHGETFISKTGITSSTFGQIPDVPVPSFELHLPAGPDSVFAAQGDLCASNLRIPTTIVAENGITVKEDPTIAVSGCKPTIKIVRHSVRGRVATIGVKVPSAGKLVVGGRGLRRVTKTVKKAGVVTLKLALTKGARRALAHHRKHGQKVAVKVLFTPAKGSRLSARVTLKMR